MMFHVKQENFLREQLQKWGFILLFAGLMGAGEYQRPCRMTNALKRKIGAFALAEVKTGVRRGCLPARDKKFYGNVEKSILSGGDFRYNEIIVK